MKTMKVTINPGYHALTGYYQDWSELVAHILRGSVERTRHVGETTFTDRWSGAEVTLVKQGAKVKSIEVTAPVDLLQTGDEKLEQVVTIDFGAAKPGAKALETAFLTHYRSGGANDPLKALDPFGIELDNQDRFEDAGFRDAGNMFRGSSHNDVFMLNKGANYIGASGGNDVYRGDRADDLVDYSLLPGAVPGSDGITLGKAGAARVVQKMDGSKDKLFNMDRLVATNGDDSLKPGLGNKGFTIDGRDGDDVIFGGRGDDALSGGFGDDVIKGQRGDDVLIGGDGRDKLIGGGGDDILVAGDGFRFSGDGSDADILRGNGGRDLFVLESDTFYFSAPSGSPPNAIIADFRNGEDFIGLAGGTSFADLTVQGVGGDTRLIHNGELLAVLKGVDADTIARDDFVEDVSPVFGWFA